MSKPMNGPLPSILREPPALEVPFELQFQVGLHHGWTCSHGVCVNSELFSCEKWFKGCIPSGKLTWQWKMDQLKMYSLIENGDFPLAMLVYRSVIIYCISFPFWGDLNKFKGLMSKILEV